MSQWVNHDLRKVVIEIKDKRGGGSGTIVNNTTTINEENNVEINLTNILHPIQSAEKHLLGKSVLLNQAYGVAKKSIMQGINLTMNRYFAMSENYIAQNNYQNFMVGVNKISSLGASIIGGAIAGDHIGGVYGAMIGGIAGSISYGITEIIGYQGRMSGFYQSLNASNYQTGFMRTRAGLTDGGKGTEN